MGFFNSLFGQADEEKKIDDFFDNLDYSNDDDEDDEYCSGSSSINESKRYYSIAKVLVHGIEDLEDEDREFVENDLEEDMHVYLRYEFDNPNDSHALQVLYHSKLLGYIEKNKAEVVHSYLRNSDIGAIIVSKISSRDFKKIVELTIYYEDKDGDKTLPYYPMEGRQISVIETDLWTGQEDWSVDWFMNITTDELLYKYNEMYDSSVDADEKSEVDWELYHWMNSYLDGTCITRKGCDLYLKNLKTECAKRVLMKRIESYLEHKDYHFADKELFTDDEEDPMSANDVSSISDSKKVVKQYDIYEISYRDGQGQYQRITIKNANMNSFIAGIKYRDNYENLLAKLSEGMEVLLKPEAENPCDPNAIAVYFGDSQLGYIPRKDVPAVALSIEGNGIKAIIDFIEEDHVDLLIPVTFYKLETMNDEELEEYRFSKRERTKYVDSYSEESSSITKEEFLLGIKQQTENT